MKSLEINKKLFITKVNNTIMRKINKVATQYAHSALVHK